MSPFEKIDTAKNIIRKNHSKKRKKIIKLSIVFVIVTLATICVNFTTNQDTLPGILLANIEALAENSELWSRDKYTKTESFTKTRVNDDLEYYDEKHAIDCQKGGIVDECTSVCETREVSFGVATQWKFSAEMKV